MNKEKIIDFLKLEKHPEGGFYREMYRSATAIQIEYNNLTLNRSASTAIYFLLGSQDISSWHRLKSDEIWHFYLGSAVKLHFIDQNGNYSSVLVGNDLEAGEIPQVLCPAGVYFAAEVVEENSFTLVGCTVSPGFDFSDFEFGTFETLYSLNTDILEIINKFL